MWQKLSEYLSMASPASDTVKTLSWCSLEKCTDFGQFCYMSHSGGTELKTFQQFLILILSLNVLFCKHFRQLLNAHERLRQACMLIVWYGTERLS